MASIALTCSRRVRKEKRGGGGRDPKFPIWATKNVMVWAQIRQEFPDVRQNEREIKFIEWEMVLKEQTGSGESRHRTGVLGPFLYPGYKEQDRGLAGHLLSG